MRISDWSSDVCSSDLKAMRVVLAEPQTLVRAGLRHLLEIHASAQIVGEAADGAQRSEEHTSELQSLMRISYAVFCLKKKKKKHIHEQDNQNVMHHDIATHYKYKATIQELIQV